MGKKNLLKHLPRSHPIYQNQTSFLVGTDRTTSSDYTGNLAQAVPASSAHEFKTLMQSSEILALVGRTDTIGVTYFFGLLEHQFYAPHLPVNDQFQLAILQWPDTKTRWLCGCIPLKDAQLADHVARDAGIILIPGTLQSVQHAEVLQFPVPNATMLVVEADPTNIIVRNPEHERDLLSNLMLAQRKRMPKS